MSKKNQTAAKNAKATQAHTKPAPALANKPGAAPMVPAAPAVPPAPPAVVEPPKEGGDLQAGGAQVQGAIGAQAPQSKEEPNPLAALFVRMPSPFVQKEGLGPYISHRVDLQARDMNAEEKAGLEVVIKAYHGKATGDWRKVASNNPQCFRLLLRDIARASKVMGEHVAMQAATPAAA